MTEKQTQLEKTLPLVDADKQLRTVLSNLVNHCVSLGALNGHGNMVLKTNECSSLDPDDRQPWKNILKPTRRMTTTVGRISIETTTYGFPKKYVAATAEQAMFQVQCRKIERRRWRTVQNMKDWLELRPHPVNHLFT